MQSYDLAFTYDWWATLSWEGTYGIAYLLYVFRLSNSNCFSKAILVQFYHVLIMIVTYIILNIMSNWVPEDA